MSGAGLPGQPAIPIASLRANAVAERWVRACRHLEEAKIGAATKAMPVATVHSAYYAMHHAARAVIISTLTGTDLLGASKHDGVVRAFGLLVRGGPPDLRQAGRDLNEIRDVRTVADYDMSTPTDDADADDALANAIGFLDLCRVHFGMAP